jgi:hypothetical protein
MRGNALGDLGDIPGTVAAFRTSLERDPEGHLAPGVHRNLALMYETLGNRELSSEHRARADEVEEALAER